MFKVDFKRLGNHWYPSLKHDDPIDLMLNEQLEVLLDSQYNSKYGEITVYMCEMLYSDVQDDENTWITFDKEDYERYLSTDDHFDIRFTYKDRQYSISSKILDAIQAEYQIQIPPIIMIM